MKTSRLQDYQQFSSSQGSDFFLRVEGFLGPFFHSHFSPSAFALSVFIFNKF
jgi:hypothetical protein